MLTNSPEICFRKSLNLFKQMPHTFPFPITKSYSLFMSVVPVVPFIIVAVYQGQGQGYGMTFNIVTLDSVTNDSVRCRRGY